MSYYFKEAKTHRNVREFQFGEQYSLNEVAVRLGYGGENRNIFFKVLKEHGILDLNCKPTYVTFISGYMDYSDKCVTYEGTMMIGDLLETMEGELELSDSNRRGIYTLRQAANKIGIQKAERHEFFEVLRRAGVIKHNNKPTFLSLMTNLFRGPLYEEGTAVFFRDLIKPVLLTKKGFDMIEGIARRTFFGCSGIYFSDERLWLDEERRKITHRNAGW